MANISKQLNITFNDLKANISREVGQQGATISYSLTSSDVLLGSIVLFGSFNVDIEFYNLHSSDDQYLLNWVADKLQITII